MSTGEMTKGEVAVWDFLSVHLPDYAQEHLVSGDGQLIDWAWLATCPMLSTGEGAVVTLAAHLYPVPWVVVQDPRTLVALLGCVDHERRVAWAVALRTVGEELVR